MLERGRFESFLEEEKADESSEKRKEGADETREDVRVFDEEWVVEEVWETFGGMGEVTAE